MKSNLYHIFLNIIPYWSSKISTYFQIGTEYNMFIHLLLSELFNSIYQSNDNTILFKITMASIFILIIYILYIFFICHLFLYMQPNVVLLIGKEINTKEDCLVIYNDKLCALNHYLVHSKKLQNCFYINNSNILFNTMYRYPLHSSIYLTITRTNLNNENKLVHYRLWSYKENVEKFLSNILTEYYSNIYSEIVFIGDETNNII